MGLAIARVFGSRGFDVALISRDRSKLNDLVSQLTAEGITAAAFPADVLNREALGQALKDAATLFDQIDVLEFSPAGTPKAAVATTPSETDLPHVQEQMEMLLYGAITATNAVLPAMREVNEGTLLYTTGTGPGAPEYGTAGVSTAAHALRSWVVNLHKQLAGTGIHAAHIGLDVTIGDSSFYGQPRATAEQIAPLYWDVHTSRDSAERFFQG